MVTVAAADTATAAAVDTATVDAATRVARRVDMLAAAWRMAQQVAAQHAGSAAARADSAVVVAAASTVEAVVAASTVVVAADTGKLGSLLTKGPSASAGGLFLACKFPALRVWPLFVD
jgi:hypothetical protein